MQPPSSAFLAGVVSFLRGTMNTITVFAAFALSLTSFIGREKSVPFHTIAWRESIADITADDISVVADSIMTVQNGHFVPQRDMFLLYASYQAAGATRARLISPSLRQITTPWIRPTAVAIVQGVESHVADYRSNPLRIKGLEELQLEAFQTTGGAAVVVSVAALADGMMQPMPAGDVYTMRGTAAATLTAGAWTLGTVTWQDTLPAGNYACVGLQYFGTTGLAARLIFEDQFWRPGCIGAGLVTSQQHPMFSKGGLGVWGRFNANRMPSIEFLGNAADTAQEVYLDFIRTG